MENLTVFENAEFGRVRTIEQDGKIWFCGSDVAKALGYADTPKAIKTHCKEDGWAIYPVIDAKGRKQQARFIDEGNLYRLIIHSKLPTAERFESWVFDEVLPAIRKTGKYEVQQHEQLQLEEPYEYIEKHWRGQIVVTVKDLSMLGNGFTKGSAHYYIREHLQNHVDYEYLNGKSLADFKTENGLAEKMRLVSSLYVITYSGVKKLVQLVNGGAVPVQKLFPDKKQQIVDVPNYVKAQSKINELFNKLAAMDVVLHGIDAYLDVDAHKHYMAVLKNLALEINIAAWTLVDMKIPIVDKKA